MKDTIHSDFPATAGGGRLGRFPCPVCDEDLVDAGALRERPCPHVPIVEDRAGDLLCFDEALYPAVIAAWERSAATGRPTLEILCERLGPGLALYQLEAAPSDRRGSAVTVVVDVRARPPAHAPA
ncbi:MAG TPA: hypothetical protein VMT17_13985 [Anaeromyxobacteraceae bacterium]|nr:hypothetical protein [Anaeromyxobacteraceae bacterium]